MLSPPKTPPPSSKFNLRRIDLTFSLKKPFLITKVPQIHEPAMTNETKNTENRLKNLKKGDPVYLSSYYDGYELAGNIQTSHCFVVKGEKRQVYTCSSPESILLPTELQQPAEKPKYDPCRPFKRGDKVRVVERHGRKFWNAAPETIYTVVADEYLHDAPNVLHRGCVGLNDGRPETLSAWNVPFFHVELITPVEELEPYFTKEDRTGLLWEVWKRDEENEAVLVASFWVSGHPNPKEAAEAECARLNAEYRKEQK